MFKNFRQRLLIPITGFFVTFILILILGIYFASNLITLSSQRLERQTEELTRTLTTNFNIYENFLKDIQGFFASSTNVERSEFRTYIENVDFVNRYPGITLIAFSKKVNASEKQSFLYEINNDPLLFSNGTDKYKINPDTEKDTYYLLYFAEPYGATTGYGFDSSATADRYINIQKAIDINEPVMTEKIALTGANAGQFTFSIYQPVYAVGTVNDTSAQREANNIGVIIASFRLNNVFAKIFADESVFKNLSVQIYTDGIEDDSTKLFDSNTKIDSVNSFSVTKNIEIANRQWNVKFTPGNAYGLSDTEKFVPVATIIIGALISIFVGIFLFQLKKSQNNALALASSAKVKLAESEAKLNNILQGVDLIVFSIDPNGIFTLSIGKGLSDLGVKPDELIGQSIFDVTKDSPDYSIIIKKALSGESITGIVKFDKSIFETRFSPILDKDGKVISVVGVSQNVTVREEYNEKLKTKTDEMERLNKMMINRELKMKELKEQLAKQP